MKHQSRQESAKKCNYNYNKLSTLPDAKVPTVFTIVDCLKENLTLGRLMSKIAIILQGKYRIDYCAHRATKDKIIVINSDQIKINSKNVRYKHTGYPGGLKTITPRDIINARRPEKIKLLKQSLRNMLPRNKQRHQQLKNIKFFLQVPSDFVNYQDLDQATKEYRIKKQFRSIK